MLFWGRQVMHGVFLEHFWLKGLRKVMILKQNSHNNVVSRSKMLKCFIDLGGSEVGWSFFVSLFSTSDPFYISYKENCDIKLNLKWILIGTTNLQCRLQGVSFEPKSVWMTPISALSQQKKPVGPAGRMIWFPVERQLCRLPNTQWVNQHLSQQHLPELENKTKLQNCWSSRMSHMGSKTDVLPLWSLTERLPDSAVTSEPGVLWWRCCLFSIHHTLL